jgi:hypothetical protein
MSAFPQILSWRFIVRKILLTSMMVAAVGLFLAPLAEAQTETHSTGGAPRSLVTYTESVLAEFANSPSIVAFIEAQNAKSVDLNQVKAMDAKWTASKVVEPYMWNIMRNSLSYTLVSFQYQNKFVVEAFAMDRRGIIVAETNRTSTYWKGKAEKFVAPYNDGKGAFWYGPAEYDDSTGEIVVQVSVPVKRGERTIGVVLFGVSLDRWEQRGRM